ncbi:MAG: hypothetical protein AAF742_01120 [Pseudomonadota bacterium]
MSRNFGLSQKRRAFRESHNGRPALTLFSTATFGTIAAAIAAIAFSQAASSSDHFFRGASLAMAVLTAGAGCWLYIFLSWTRIAANFTGGDAFSQLLVFYGKATVGLLLAAFLAWLVSDLGDPVAAGLAACFVGGAAAAGAFQTVITFVPSAPNE